MAERIKGVNQSNKEPPLMLFFYEVEKNVLRGEYVIRSVCPFVTYFQRLTRFSDFHEIHCRSCLQKVVDKCQFPVYCLSDGHTLSKDVN
jgi:hypothetical protein